MYIYPENLVVTARVKSRFFVLCPGLDTIEISEEEYMKVKTFFVIEN